MGPNIYKPGQGFWTRTMSAIGFGLIAAMGGAWFADLFSGVRIEGVENIYIWWGAFVVIVAICGLMIYWFFGKSQKAVDFMIATEGEMKKVNWSTRREIFGMTWVVIGLTIFIALFVAFFDYLVFFPIFEQAGVIETS